MIQPSPAVFLSYASQDAEMARRLAEALRAAGVEVWFDLNELQGGDAWDAKIRGQIASCALFVPLISAATQTRLEGYFRLEWHLAEQRCHLMAKGRPFLLPVVIDGILEPEAQVPDAFREIQWTRLGQPGSEDRFAARVRTLMERLCAPTPASAVNTAAPAGLARPRAATGAPWMLRRFARPLAALLLLGSAALVARFPASRSAAPASPSAQVAEDSPELRRAFELSDFNAVETARADFDLAEQILDRELVRDPTNPRTVQIYAWLQCAYVVRGFDSSDVRLAKARRYAELALQLTPNAPEALGALGFYLYCAYTDVPRAEQLLRRAIAINPREPKYHRILGWVLASQSLDGRRASGLPRPGEPRPWLDVMEAAVAAFPRDSLVRYDLSMICFGDEDYPRALAELDAALALAPISTALRDRAWMALWWEGRPADMTPWLDRIGERSRAEDHTVIARYVEACVTSRFEPAHSLLRGMPSIWLNDHVRVPKNLLLGDLFLQQGKPALARVQLEAALSDIARARVEAPTEVSLRQFEAWTLLRLGRTEEARDLLDLIIEAQVDWVSPQGGLFWFGSFQLSLLLDDVPAAMRCLRAQATTPNRRHLLRNLLRIDPRLAAWRDHPAINAALAEPPTAPPVSAAQVDPVYK